MQDGPDIIMMLFTFGLFFILFLVLRELVCWYFKINTALDHIKSIDISLKLMSGRAEPKQSRVSTYIPVKEEQPADKARTARNKKVFNIVIYVLAFLTLALIVIGITMSNP